MKNVVAGIFAITPFAVLDVAILLAAKRVSATFWSGALAAVVAIAVDLVLCATLFKSELNEGR